MAESGLPVSWCRFDFNDRYRVKRTFWKQLPNYRHSATALPLKADIKLNLVKRSANDPKATSRFMELFVFLLRIF